MSEVPHGECGAAPGSRTLLSSVTGWHTNRYTSTATHVQVEPVLVPSPGSPTPMYESPSFFYFVWQKFRHDHTALQWMIRGKTNRNPGECPGPIFTKRGIPGIEPGTSRTRSEHNATIPNPRDTCHCWRGRHFIPGHRTPTFFLFFSLPYSAAIAVPHGDLVASCSGPKKSGQKQNHI